MNVLITGASGFLGSHLANYYLNSGCTVVGIDNFSSSNRNSHHHNALLRKKNYYFYEHDITELNRSSKKLMDIPTKFDLIMNFACPASPPRYQQIPVETMMTCTLGVKNILDLARKHESVVVHASTSEVYGDPTFSPQPESYRGNVNCWGPRSNYDEGKRSAEALAFDYQNKFGVDVRLVRIFNTYGPSMDPSDGRVVSNLLVQAINNQPLTIYGDGSQTRSFCYVDDLINAITKMAGLSKNPNTPINIGNPGEYTILELAKMVSRLSGKELLIQTKPFPTDDPMQRCPDITLAKSILGWEPTVNLETGLLNTYEYFKYVLRS